MSQFVLSAVMGTELCLCQKGTSAEGWTLPWAVISYLLYLFLMPSAQIVQVPAPNSSLLATPLFFPFPFCVFPLAPLLLLARSLRG